MRRVAITGLGIVCPLGVKVDEVWAGLLTGESGVTMFFSFSTDDLSSKFAGQVPS